MKPAKILFFVDGVAPTPKDFKEASELTAQVSFRNARAIQPEATLEECDGVAGCVPSSYKKLPTAEQAIKSHAAALAELSMKVGDKPAPKVPEKNELETANGAEKNKKAPTWTPNAQQK